MGEKISGENVAKKARGRLLQRKRRIDGVSSREMSSKTDTEKNSILKEKEKIEIETQLKDAALGRKCS